MVSIAQVGSLEVGATSVPAQPGALALRREDVQDLEMGLPIGEAGFLAKGCEYHRMVKI